jgi:GTPase SAR1 family protein
MSIFDFGGQEAYREGHQFFFKHRSVFLIVFDLDPNHKNDMSGKTGREEALRELGEWLVLLQAHIERDSRDVMCFIVGNKLDKVNDNMASRALEVKKCIFDTKFECAYEYYEVSSYDADENITALRHRILRAMTTQPQMGELVPPASRHLQSYFSSIKKSMLPPLMSIKEVISSVTFQVLDEKEIKRLLFLLDHWGHCIYFSDSLHLNSIVFLDSEWLMRDVVGALLLYLGIYYIL